MAKLRSVSRTHPKDPTMTSNSRSRHQESEVDSLLQTNSLHEQEQRQEDKIPTLSDEVCDIFRLAIPIFISRLSFIGVRQSTNSTAEITCLLQN